MRETLLAVVGWLLICPVGRGTEPGNEIRFHLIHGFAIVTRGEIGALKGLNFMIDTGAVPSVISTRIAAQLGTQGVSGSFAVASNDSEGLSSGSATALYVTIKEVHVGWIRAAELPMVIVDLRQLERNLGIRIDAIVGLDIFAGQDFSIDYQHHKVTKGLSGMTRHRIPGDIRTAAGAPYWIVQVTLGGQPLRFLLDTGANDLAVFEDAPEPSFLNDRRRPGTAQASRIVPTVQASNTPQTLLALGDVPLENQQTVKLARPAGVLGDIDGLLGPTAVRVTRLEFDWANKAVLWNAE